MTLETYRHNLPTCGLEVEEYPFFLACVGLLEMLDLKKIKKPRQAEMIALYHYYRSKLQLADNLDVLDNKVSVHSRNKLIIGCADAIRQYATKYFNSKPASGSIF